jgi:hypothetical protein
MSSVLDFLVRLPGDAAATGGQRLVPPQLAAHAVGAVAGALDPAPVRQAGEQLLDREADGLEQAPAVEPGVLGGMQYLAAVKGPSAAVRTFHTVAVSALGAPDVAAGTAAVALRRIAACIASANISSICGRTAVPATSYTSATRRLRVGVPGRLSGPFT